MSRKSYPIIRQYLVLLLLAAGCYTETAAQTVNNPADRAAVLASKGFVNSDWFLLFVLAIIIGFSIVYRRFMYNRLLTNKKNQAAIKRAGSAWGATNGIDGVLEQVVRQETPYNPKTQKQLLHNLRQTVELLQEQVAFFQEEIVSETLHEMSQRLYTLTAIHNNMSQEEYADVVDLNELVPQLVDHFTSFAGNESRTHFIYSSSSGTIELPVHQALSLTFFINEVLAFFGRIKSENYFSQSVGLYLQETEGHVKLTVRTEGLDISGEYGLLKRNLHQQVHKYFPDLLHPRLIIDQGFGTSIHLQFEKSLSASGNLLTAGLGSH